MLRERRSPDSMKPFDSDDFEPTIAVGPTRGPEQAPVREVFGNYLVVIAGADAGKRVEISDTPITIGRDARQTLVFDDTQLSRLHTRVSLVNGEVVAEDLKSTNGTFVDGVRLTAPATLREGQVLRVGGQLLTYERRSRREIDRAEELDRDLQRASNYVFSLLPEPITSGLVRAHWRFVPSTQLGGDAFGYYWLDPQHIRVLPPRRVRPRRRLRDALGHRAERASPARATRRGFQESGGSADESERQVSDGRPRRAVLHDVVRRVRHRRSHAELRVSRSSSGVSRVARSPGAASARHAGADDRRLRRI